LTDEVLAKSVAKAGSFPCGKDNIFLSLRNFWIKYDNYHIINKINNLLTGFEHAFWAELRKMRMDEGLRYFFET